MMTDFKTLFYISGKVLYRSFQSDVQNKYIKPKVVQNIMVLTLDSPNAKVQIIPYCILPVGFISL